MTELTKTDKLRWREFIGTDAGQKGMLWLRESIPSISGDSPHQTIFQAGFNQGYIRALDKVSETLIVRDAEVENPDNP